MSKEQPVKYDAFGSLNINAFEAYDSRVDGQDSKIGKGD